ncbi:hypothetical protein DVA86_20480 [Streptomyces armeniacus]|uniref:Uncharacterized protein n=1 Tax=Streptomyces armeniacus TaxID=83291 RepID=A0A345XSQ5_9ACTN|nr:hypothetical protein [Streptomyces armeniacus]AXK34671.1 hypothetical protein DVA86_20480 [Streptomyces armeniacus]
MFGRRKPSEGGSSNEITRSEAKTVAQAGTVRGDVRTTHIEGDGTVIVQGDNHGGIGNRFNSN